ncbi:superoxide dismutase family protein [Hyphococcus flavus]|uniref:Superoxide dismutase [Cu-Zn] n=1 Tax=Hyphococcus flavus TaxID=1866326 RepID=A0AAE9ZEF7_9PROT|nr:superoxide dismutase family protein [Hyphococcus flavus]WDI31263.1 superoxide dismutase family protein [Hyphococcus flavus]
MISARNVLEKFLILLRKYLVISMASAICLMACGNNDRSAESSTYKSTDFAPLAEQGWADAEAVFSSVDGAEKGRALFKNAPGLGVMIRVSVSGLTQGWHAIHLHQVADCSDGAEGFKASGGHINPDNAEHGLLNPKGYEAADMPNIYAGADGSATAEVFNPRITLTGDNGVIDADGFAVIVHESPDDHMTQPIGGAGARVACAAVAAG